MFARNAVVILLFLCVMLPPVSALETIDSQESIVLTIERGSSFEFPLMLQDVNEASDLSIEGDLRHWMGFGSSMDSSITISPWQPYVIVRIEVPEDAEPDEYYGDIKWGKVVVSSVAVKATLELSDVKAFGELYETGEEVGGLADKVVMLSEDIGSLRGQVATLQYNVSQKVEEIYQYQKDLDELEEEKATLDNDYENLKSDYEKLQGIYTETETTKQELNKVTGAIVSTQLPGMFIVGIFMGVFLVLGVLRRQTIKRKLKSKLGIGVPVHKKEQFRYSYKKQ